jgi:hypothetical protein
MFTGLSRVNKVIVRSLSNIQTRPVVLLTTFDRTVTQIGDVKLAGGWNPSQGVHITDKNLVFIYLWNDSMQTMSITDRGRGGKLVNGLQKLPYFCIQERHHVRKLRTPFLTLAMNNKSQ